MKGRFTLIRNSPRFVIPSLIGSIFMAGFHEIVNRDLLREFKKRVILALGNQIDCL